METNFIRARHCPPPKHRRRKETGAHTFGHAVVLTLGCLLIGPPAAKPAAAQTVTPPSISLTSSSPVCSSGQETVQNTCIDLPPGSIIDKVDVFLLFDDTGSFAGTVPAVTSIFSGLVTDLETALPGVEFGFGVGRFEDYGGVATGFSGENVDGRPFILNQPIVTAADAGGAAARDALIAAALGATAPGFGGDGPESAIAEALYQVATGVGFDGDEDSTTTGSDGTQVAGASSTQTAPDTSGDVPAFSTLDATVVSSGPVGGVGFRSTALRLVILATDVCSIAAFDPTVGIPTNVTGTGSTEPVTAFACSTTTPGVDRFGFVSDSKDAAGNTVSGAVVPLGAGTVPATIAALNAAGIRVLGMGPGVVPTSSPGPSSDPSVFESALARMTGAVDGTGAPLVFDTAGGGTALQAAIVNAVTTTTTAPINISMAASGALPPGLGVGFSPAVVADVQPGGTACFTTTFTGGSPPPTGSFALDFKDVASGAVLGTIPVDISCTLCGNGVLEGNEQCDDGNTAGGDCCSASCTFESSGASCEDGDACTANDTCDGAGSCIAGSLLSCNDGDVCTVDSCDNTSGCVNTAVADGTSCDDGDLCNGAETCQAGTCTTGAPPDCDDGDSCTVDSCDSTTGCVHAAVADGTACDDGSDCTLGDLCQGGSCLGAPTTLFPTCDWVVVGGDASKDVKLRTRRNATANGDFCADTGQVGTGTQQNGSVVATETTGNSVILFLNSSSVSGEIVTGGGGVRTKGMGVPLPGAAASSVAPGSTLARLDPLGDIDATGANPLVTKCEAAQAGIDSAEADVVARPADASFGNIDIGKAATGTISAVVPGAVNVIDMNRLVAGRNATLNIDGGGDPATVMVLRMATKFRIGARAEIQLIGGLTPENLLFYTPGGVCKIGRNSTGAGTILCPNARSRLNPLVHWTGALLGGKAEVRLGFASTITHQPFLGF